MTRKKKVTLAHMNGDHGPAAKAFTTGTRMEKLDGPNRMARRRRVERLEEINLSMRQLQAGREIRNAYCRVQQLSSGSPLSERVDGTKKPDKVIDVQVGANSRLAFVMAAVPQAMRYVVEAVCWRNEPLHACDKGQRNGSASTNLKVALDLVANRLKY